jgi:CheY-like chemotaxis protein
MHLLERRCGDDATQQLALRAVRRNATYLFALAENLLEYGRGEAAPTLLNPVAVDLPALVADLDAMFRPLAEDKGLGFAIELGDVPRDGLFDEIKLRQIAINLLSNALRYTLRGEVAAKVAGDGKQLLLEVRDTGIGVPAEARESVFTPFNRGGQHGSKGAGLGLSIVKRLVEQMHGTLELESELGAGSTFRVRLPPLGQASAGETSQRPGDRPTGADELWLKDYRAIVLDDDPDVSGLLALLLEDLGFEVEVLREAAQAVARVRQMPPHVLLVDVELPGLSGNAAVYQLRAQGYRGRIITLSATATEEARAAALAAGADFYLTKPLNLEQFVRVLQRAVHS